MIINETLANGLKNRFFDEISDEIDSRYKSLYTQTRGVKNSRTGWSKLAEKFKNNFDRCSIVFYEGGSKRKPYFGICSLAINKEKPYNSWNEKCLYGFPVINCFEPRLSRPSLSLFNVGEHAISRLYQRGNIKVKNETDVDIYSILPEFHLLPLWAMFWARMISELLIDNEQIDIRPVLPSKSGLFLAEISINKIPTIEIRTFVDDSQLSDLQKEVKKIFIEASAGIQSSPLVFYPANEFFGIDDCTLQLHIMSHRIVKYSEKIAKVFFYHIIDDKERFHNIQIFCELIKSFASGTSDEISETFKDEKIRIINAIYLKLDREESFHK